MNIKLYIPTTRTTKTVSNQSCSYSLSVQHKFVQVVRVRLGKQAHCDTGVKSGYGLEGSLAVWGLEGERLCNLQKVSMQTVLGCRCSFVTSGLQQQILNAYAKDDVMAGLTLSTSV